MTAPALALKPSKVGLRQRIRPLVPYLLLAPGILWLLVFFVVPAIQMFLMSVSSGSLDEGFKVTFSTRAYERALTRFGPQFSNSLLFAGLATAATFLIGFPVAYTIAFGYAGVTGASLLWSILVAFVGAVVLLIILRAITGRRVVT